VKIIAIVPAYNEEATIGEVVADVRKYVNEVLVIDDGSIDNTKKIAAERGAIVISHPVNRGYGEATQLGFKRAIERGADIIVQLDADGQYATSEIPSLIKPILADSADVVFGSRFAGEIKYKMPFMKKLGNKVLTRILRFFTKLPLTDGQTGFRAYKRQVLRPLIFESSYTISHETILRIGRYKWRFMEVPVMFNARTSGESRLIRHKSEYLKNFVLILVKIFRDYHPLLFFGVIGVALFLVGFILGLYLLWLFVSFGKASVLEHQLTLLLAIILGVGGLQIALFGLLADMISSVKEKFSQPVEEG